MVTGLDTLNSASQPILPRNDYQKEYSYFKGQLICPGRPMEIGQWFDSHRTLIANRRRDKYESYGRRLPGRGLESRNWVRIVIAVICACQELILQLDFNLFNCMISFQESIYWDFIMIFT